MTDHNPPAKYAEHGDAQPASVTMRKRLMMPAVVAGLLGGHVLFVVIAITLATSDRSFAVVPDYYQKAVDYDLHKAELAASEQLGWKAELLPGAEVDTRGRRDILVLLHDGSGDPVTNAVIGVSCYHLARAGDPQSFDLVEDMPGRYVGRVRMQREGFWQFELSAERGADKFVADWKQFVYQPEPTR